MKIYTKIKPFAAIGVMMTLLLPLFAFLPVSADAPPTMQTVIINETFNQDTVPEWIQPEAGTPALSQADGRLTIDSGTKGFTRTNFGLGENLAGSWILDFDLERKTPASDIARIYIGSFQLQWAASPKQFSVTAPGSSAEYFSENDYNTQTAMHAVICRDEAAQSLSVWVNDKLVKTWTGIESNSFVTSVAEITTHAAGTVIYVKELTYGLLEGAEEPTDDFMPEVAEEKLRADFSGSNVPSWIDVQASAAPALSMDVGRVKIDAGAKSFTRTYLHLNEKAKGDWVMRFKLSRSLTGSDSMRIYINNFSFQWVASAGKFSVGVPGNGNEYFAEADFGTKTNLDAVFYHNSQTGEITVWANRKKVGTWNVTDSSKLETDAVELTTHSQNATIYVKDFYYYVPVAKGLEPAQQVTKDCEYLQSTGILQAPLTESGYMADDLSLPQTGQFGSSITWETASPDVLDVTTGYIERAETETNLSVTAHVSAEGAAERTVTFGPYKIPAAGKAVDGVPAPSKIMYREPFDELGSRITLNNGPNGIVHAEDGVLKIVSNTSDAGITCARVYLNDERTTVGGKLGFEFTLGREAIGSNILIWPNGTQNRHTDIRWMDNRVAIYTVEGDVYTPQNFYVTEFDGQKKLKVTMVIDTDNGRADFLLNNKLVLEDAAVNPGGISHLYFFMESRAASITVDNFKFYYCGMDDERTVRYDSEELTDSRLFGSAELSEGMIAGNLTLPAKGDRGSIIRWVSSAPDVIAADGTVTRGAEDTPVTLTATFTSGEATVTKTYQTTVLRGGDGDLEVLRADFDALTRDSLLRTPMPSEGLLTDSLHLYTTAPHGSTILWQSSNETLIAADGTVSRPQDGSEDIYVTLTATVTNGDFSLSKSFTFGVVPLDQNVAEFPELTELELVHLEPFTKHIPEIDGDGERNYINPYDNNLDYNIAPHASTRGWNGYIEEHDGWVEVCRNANEFIPLANSVPNTNVTLYFQPSKENIGDLAAASFMIKREGVGAMTQYFRGSSGVVTMITWNSDGRFNIKHRTADGSVAETLTKPFTGTIRQTVLSDSVSGRFSVWMNGECVARELYPYSIGCAGLLSYNADIGGTNFFKFYFSDVRAFKAQPTDWMRPGYDAEWLTEDMIRGIYPAPAAGKLNADLNLITEGRYGSSITWESSDESLVTADGKVNRPQDLGFEPQVTITATLRYGIFRQQKTFTFTIMPIYGADETVAEQDAAFLTLDNFTFFSFTDSDPTQVTSSLSLPSGGPYGSTYLWQSSNENVITNSGRVIRERWDGSPQTVTMKAVIVYGSAVKTKELTFTVLPDEEIQDPQYMSDAEFFGVWENGAWKSEGKFDYSRSGLKGIEAAVKNGNDYETAKQELLTYMRNRPKSFLSTGVARDPGFVNGFMVTGVHTTRYSKNYQGLGVIRSRAYQQYEIPVKARFVNKGSYSSYKLGARYNEDTAVRILSRESADPSVRPKLLVKVDGSYQTFEACGDMTIRGGSNRYRNYGDEQEMEVRMFGEFQGEKTADTVLNFDLTGLSTSCDVTDAKLLVTAKLEEPYAKSKELLVYLEGSDWTEDGTNMDNFMEVACNFNGIPGGNDWRYVKNAESEYMTQHVRMEFFKETAAEYVYTGDETYAYTILWNLMDFIRDTQGEGTGPQWINSGWIQYSDLASAPGGMKDIVWRGMYPSALSTAMRLQSSLIPMLESVMNSRYMTANVCTAILKNLWDNMTELERYLTDERVANLGANQKVYESEAYGMAAMFLPEFSVSQELILSSKSVMENLVRRSYFADGAYIEATDGYSTSVMSSFTEYWKKLKMYGLDYSEEVQQRLYKAAVYNSLLIAPYGIGIAWGDNGKTNSNLTPKNELFYDLMPDEEFLFINTYGRKGVMPKWTSRLYEGPMYALMRSDWTDDAMFTLMDSSGFGGHGHADTNSMTVNAFRRSFLIDPGYYNYDNASPIRRYMISTRAHNTVEVDNTSQNYLLRTDNIDTAEAEKRGKKHNWVTNGAYDFFSVTSGAYDSIDPETYEHVDGVKHRRSVVMLKPDFWIVSDLLTPPENETAHTYRQLWHMSAASNMGTDTEKNLIYSDFSSGANMKIVSADTGASLVKEMGYDTFSWGVAEEAPYAYYMKQDVTGKETFDTVLFPYKTEGDVSVERIDLGVPTYDATAMKITSTVDGTTNNTYYMLDYDHEAGATHTFGQYETDAELALVRENADGTVAEAIINGGSYIKNASGKVVLKASETVGNLSFEQEGSSIKLQADDAVDIKQVAVMSNGNIKNVFLNGSAIRFYVENDQLVFSREKGDVVEDNDPSGNRGGVTGGGGGGATDPKPTETPKPTDTPKPDDDKTFNDIEGHWAEEAVRAMAKEGVLNGYGTLFMPENNVTRAELAAMAVRSAGLAESSYQNTFSDVKPTDWFAGVIQTALDNGIISQDTAFRPNDTVTREEMCKIIVLTARLMQKLQEQKADLPDYTDKASIADWASDFVVQAAAEGLMQGMDDGRFMPKASATRAQAATVFYRLLRSEGLQQNTQTA